MIRIATSMASVASSMEKMPRKARAMLNRLIENRQLTPGGLNWLINATDPFHDSTVDLCGYPDLTNTNTLVQCFQFTQTVNSFAGGAYDAHIVFNPMTPPLCGYGSSLIPFEGDDTDTDSSLENELLGLKSRVSTPALPYAVYQPNVMTLGGVIPTPIGIGQGLYPGWNVMIGNVGFDYLLSPTANGTNATYGISMPQPSLTGSWRLIGTAVEVVNTTPELYKGGACSVYRSPNPVNIGQMSWPIATVPGTYYTTTAQFGVVPPSTSSVIMTYPSSKMWSAEEGAYVIAASNSVDMPFVTYAPCTSALISQPTYAQLYADSAPPGGLLYPFYGYFPQQGTSGGTISAYGAQSCSHILPYDISGICFSGLSIQSTLQVTVKYFVERDPGIQDPTMLVLARPPPTDRKSVV